jgi:glycosyltransferase involved in cell wall biosynthesis
MKISVIVPAYNEEKYIETTLKSIKSQKTGLDYEIIVSDCKSTDKTMVIAKKYADKIVASEKRSIAAARNTGAKHAQGKILVFIDADTILMPDYLEFIYSKFQEDKALIALTTGFKITNRSTKYLLAEKIANEYLDIHSKLSSTILVGINLCVHKYIFDKIGGFKDILLEDAQISKDLEKIGKTKFFSDKKVIVSSRKPEKMGLLGTLRYYFELDLVDKKLDKPLKKIGILKNHGYKEIR